MTQSLQYGLFSSWEGDLPRAVSLVMDGSLRMPGRESRGGCVGGDVLVFCGVGGLLDAVLVGGIGRGCCGVVVVCRGPGLGALVLPLPLPFPF